MTKKLNKQVYSLQKQCSFHIFLIGTGIDPCFSYRDSQEWQQSSPQSSKPFLCLTPCVKARKSFHIVLPCLVMMYHQTNLDCKSFSISEDLVETIVALTLNIAKYFCMILWLMMIDQRYCPGKHSLKFRTFTVTLTLNTAKQPFHVFKTLQLINMHCQTKLVAKNNNNKTKQKPTTTFKSAVQNI